jgi:hypothetical protein
MLHEKQVIWRVLARDDGNAADEKETLRGPCQSTISVMTWKNRGKQE